MAMLVTHLRRIVLLFTLVYLFSDFVESTFCGVQRSQVNFHKKLHIQLWVYIYTVYIYALLENCSMRENLNMFNVLFPTS